MPYKNDIPKPTDKLRDSQSELLDNYAEIKTVIDINHDTFGDANQGKHKYLNIPEVAAAADPLTAANEMALYTKAVGGITAMFLKKEGIAFGTAGMDFTTYDGVDPATGYGYCTLPSGIIIKWGLEVPLPIGNTAVNLNAIGTNFTNAYLPLLTPRDTGVVSYVYNILPTTLTITNTGIAGNCYWLVIGD